MDRRRTILGITTSLAIAQGTGGLGWLLSRGAMSNWYRDLRKPSWSPPDWVFGPAWTTLFALMGVSSWLVWRKREQPGARAALALYGLQLGLNAAWSGVFFGFRRPRAALYELGALWTAIAGTTVAFWRVDRTAGALLLPYLAWTTFAGLLNKKIVDLNPQKVGEGMHAEAQEEWAGAWS